MRLRFISRLREWYIRRSLAHFPVPIEFGLGVEAQRQRPLGNSFPNGRHGTLNVARRAVGVVVDIVVVVAIVVVVVDVFAI